MNWGESWPFHENKLVLFRWSMSNSDWPMLVRLIPAITNGTIKGAVILPLIVEFNVYLSGVVDVDAVLDVNSRDYPAA